MFDSSDDPACFSISSKDYRTKSRLKEYWEKRSRGYNLTTLLELHNSEKYEHLVNSLVPRGRRAKICDIGTSCGFMAIVAARMGHEVTGIDFQSKMTRYARSNAKKFNLNIDFKTDDLETMDLGNESYDLIIAKNVIWCLSKPVSVLRKCMDALRPGGHILIIDGNYYLGNTQSDYAKRMHFKDLQNSENNSIHGMTNMDRIDFSEIRNIALDLPASNMRRPSWDVSVLMGLEMDNIYVNTDEKEPFRIMTSSGYMSLTGTFVITARKPPTDSDPLIYCNSDITEPLLNDSELDRYTAVFKALADRNRVNILHILMKGRMNVKSISELTGISVSLVSHNLKVLASSGLVTSSKNGKEVYYFVSDYTKLEELMYYCLK